MTSWPKAPWLSFVLPYLGCVLGLLLYAQVRDGTIAFEWSQAFTELPLGLYLFTLLMLPLRALRVRAWVAAWPLLWLYLLHDEYFVRWGNVPTLADVALFADLFEVLGPVLGSLTMLAIALPFVIWLWALSPLKAPGRGVLLLCAPAMLVSLLFVGFPSQSYERLNSFTEDEEWSDRRNTERWGRLYSVLFREMRRLQFEASLSSITPLSRSPLRLSPKESQSLDGRNVHVIVMESFVDVRLLSKVTFSKPPFDPAFAARVDPTLSASVSPVFGGETARAEFEVLCGVPSLRLYGLEFLGFSGSPTYCLPTILREAGYTTVLTFPHGPVFFNTRRAYPGLGFEQVIYADRFSAPGEESIVLGDQDYLDDTDLLPQNLAKVKKLLGQGKPFLNYVMTMYGHWPFDIDRARHPDEISVSPTNDDVHKIASQMLIRTRALEAYVEELLRLDPHSLILLVGDHLPPLPAGKADYLRLGYTGRSGLLQSAPDFVTNETPLMVWVDGTPTKLPRMRHFDLSHYLLDQLSHGLHCKLHPCDFGRVPYDRKAYVDSYQTILGLAAKPPSKGAPN